MRLDHVTGRGLKAQIAGIARPDPGLLHGGQGIAEAAAEAAVERWIAPSLDARGLAVMPREGALRVRLQQISNIGAGRLAMRRPRGNSKARAADRRAP